MGYSYPGLAQATGTRVDSAAKHNIAVRVSGPLFACWCIDQKNPRNHLHREKMRYCMHKDELVLNVSQSLCDSSTIVSTAKAYPHVVTNLGDMTTATQNLLCLMYNFSQSGQDFLKFKSSLEQIVKLNDVNTLTEMGIVVDSESITKTMREIKDLPYFTAMGYALTTAYACDLTGDTVGTVIIGGMQTVLNGAFEVKAGEMVQWYFDFEEDFFYKKTTEDKINNTIHVLGSRKDAPKGTPLDTIRVQDHVDKSVSQINRENFAARGLGDIGSFPKNTHKTNIAFPKPYKLRCDGSEHYGDKIRVFAKCINGGRGGDTIDIMMMTQCM